MTSIIPPEWAPHQAMWLGFPSHEEHWLDHLAPARAEVADLARALAGPGREQVKLLVRGAPAEAAAQAMLGNVPGIDIVAGDFGDIWLRDTGPIFSAVKQCVGFKFNGWGGKYDLPGDETVAEQIAAHAGASLARYDFVLEGGAVDHDGEGTVLTTRQCLLNPNRNPGWHARDAELALTAAIGARHVIWLGEGLKNDHTDGHVDNLARFVGPGQVVCPMVFGLDDPNIGAYDAAMEILAEAVDAEGRRLRVQRIPSPGLTRDDEGNLVPASHMNFLIANGAVIVPQFDDFAGRFALEALAEIFPDRQVIGLPSRAVLTGGGSFHCISQQVPA